MTGVAADSVLRPLERADFPAVVECAAHYPGFGSATGVFLQLTGAVEEDLEIPGRDYTFAGLQAAQAAGDRQALESRERPLVRLHLTDRKRGINQLLHAVRELS